MISKNLQILGLQPQISKVEQFFPQQVRTILVTKYQDNQIKFCSPVPSEEVHEPSHLTELLSVADVAFNEFRPELSDEGRNNVIIEETKTTEGLIRECLLCHKRILG